MIKTVLIVCFLAVTLAAPAPEEILSYDAEDHKHSQTGDAGNAVKGSYSYTADGKTFTINYEADEKGYRATGDHLPVAPEVPVAPAVAAPEVPVVEAKSTPVVSTVPLPAPAFPFGYYYAPAPHFGYSYGLNYAYPGFSYFV
ncbi:hypothetical protein GHT06_010924 [Daphnia sinensis]|uniref:Uncharacterized protein n=1 Tax=Daphnia sinensis TaxID=1820382 RepID=A0AAD5PXD4_9CRUS|nr:hypothetical protein GHT06_010924 [Daphnia sinensis]